MRGARDLYGITRRLSGTALECHRLTMLGEAFDGLSAQRVHALNLPWRPRLWEVGAGAGSFAHKLHEWRPEAGLTVTDTDLSALDATVRDVATVLIHDVEHEVAPLRDVDLIHARMVVGLLSDPLRVTQVLLRATQPGGWLVLEELLIRAAYQNGVDTHCAAVWCLLDKSAQSFGRNLGWLENLSLADVGPGVTDLVVRHRPRSTPCRGGSVLARLWAATFLSVRRLLGRLGSTNRRLVDAAIDELHDPLFVAQSPPLLGLLVRRAACFSSADSGPAVDSRAGDPNGRSE
jgi:SAM-dependent methyltransferase